MARYDYKCPACELVFEVEHGMDERPLVICPACGHEAARVFEVSGIALKGSGFYNTDMRDKSSSKTADRAKDDKKSDASSSESSGPSKSGSSKSESSKSESSTSSDTGDKKTD